MSKCLIELDIKIVNTAEEKLHSGHDILFDDGNPVAEELIREGNKSNVTLFLIEQPWNVKYEYSKSSTRIISVKNLETGIKELIKSRNQ